MTLRLRNRTTTVVSHARPDKGTGTDRQQNNPDSNVPQKPLSNSKSIPLKEPLLALKERIGERGRGKWSVSKARGSRNRRLSLR
ncbi:hypothetical protein PAXRUDRAFT_832599 [Paxillus rubicundulus Ve08.2h10]|uniref:Uncharacterized protein n=1 Tax=Paxillus rubicundulus Ve08.2h10 TaxID=930991 RepID=A0A0D0DCA5_9AGAM|nr:hypothetical protein PAXRUDRAFT_832599 [Paxillus rubicundulus Ve08.2h10]